MGLPDDSLEWRCKTASDPRSSAETLQMLAEDEDEQVRRSLAGHQNCPPDLLKRFAFDKDDGIRRTVASNPACPHELLMTLSDQCVFVDLDYLESIGGTLGDLIAGDGCPEVVMANPALPERLLDVMVPDITERDERVRRSAASYRDSPAVLLDQLAYDRAAEVREGVAGHRNTPSDALVHLASDEADSVRHSVVLNGTSPARALELLASDPVSYIRSTAREQLGKDPSCPPWLLEEIATGRPSPAAPTGKHNQPEPLSGSLRERMGIAGNPSAPAGLLAQLAQDRDPGVREEVAGNPSCPAGSLERLASERDRRIRVSVAVNPRCPQRLLEVIAKSARK